MTHWRETTLGQLLRIKHGFAFKGEFFADDGPYVLLTPGNFRAEGGLKLKGEREKYYVGPVPEDFVMCAGDIVVAMTDLTQNAPILGSAAVVPESARYLHNQRLGKVVDVDSSQVTREFVYYLFNSGGVRAAIRASATGATVRHTAPERIYSVPVSLPHLDVQRRIAGILSAYDDLIENCERRTRVLDEMARSLYREWFVEFRFPGATGSGMPKAWKSGTAASLVREFRRGVPKGSMSASLPYVGLEHIPRRSLALNEWIETAELGSNKLRFEPGEVLFGKIRPYFHKVAVAPFVGVCSADTFVVSSTRPEYRAFVTCLVSSDAFVAHASATANGAKMPRANWDVLMEFPVAVPPDELVARFSAIVDPCIQQQMQLVRQAKNLRVTRDLLLPRLLSGQLSVDDAA